MWINVFFYAVTARLLTKVTHVKRHYVENFSAEFQESQWRNMEWWGRNSSTPLVNYDHYCSRHRVCHYLAMAVSKPVFTKLSLANKTSIISSHRGRCLSIILNAIQYFCHAFRRHCSESSCLPWPAVCVLLSSFLPARYERQTAHSFAPTLQSPRLKPLTLHWTHSSNLSNLSAT